MFAALKVVPATSFAAGKPASAVNNASKPSNSPPVALAPCQITSSRDAATLAATRPIK